MHKLYRERALRSLAKRSCGDGKAGNADEKRAGHVCRVPLQIRPTLWREPTQNGMSFADMPSGDGSSASSFGNASAAAGPLAFFAVGVRGGQITPSHDRSRHL